MKLNRIDENKLHFSLVSSSSLASLPPLPPSIIMAFRVVCIWLWVYLLSAPFIISTTTITAAFNCIVCQRWLTAAMHVGLPGILIFHALCCFALHIHVDADMRNLINELWDDDVHWGGYVCASEFPYFTSIRVSHNNIIHRLMYRQVITMLNMYCWEGWQQQQPFQPHQNVHGESFDWIIITRCCLEYRDEQCWGY